MIDLKYGTINCSCGQQFYFESMGIGINCIKCAKPHDISEYPEKVEVVEEEVVEVVEVKA